MDTLAKIFNEMHSLINIFMIHPLRDNPPHGATPLNIYIFCFFFRIRNSGRRRPPKRTYPTARCAFYRRQWTVNCGKCHTPPHPTQKKNGAFLGSTLYTSYTMYELCGPPSLKNLEFQNSFPASGGSTEWAMNDAHCWQADRRRRSSYSNFQEAGVAD